jgi:hypothetical protein
MTKDAIVVMSEHSEGNPGGQARQSGLARLVRWPIGLPIR